MRTKLKKTYLSSLLILLLLFPSFILHAEDTQDVNITNTVDTSTDISSISTDLTDTASGLMDSLLGDLGINTDTLSNFISTFNVYSQKETPPQVSLIFSPTNPEIGEKITATATPTFFTNDSKDLYFTWFLKLKDCDKTDDPSADEKDKCDLNDDDKVDIEDYKIKAMRTIANDGFSWESADYSSSADGKSSFDATFGGNNQKGKTAYCYVNDVGSGKAFLLDCDSHFFPNSSDGTTGDGDFGRDEEKFWHTDPTSADTAQTGNTDESNVAGLGINSFTWSYNTGDEVGVVVEGVATDPGTTEDSSYRTMFAAPNGLCYKTTIDEGVMPEVSSLNDCLYDNFVSPSENSPSSKKIDVSLSYSPTSPINDPATYSDSKLSNGDTLSIQSSLTNSTDNAYLQYSWSVFQSDEAAPDDWGDPIAKSDLPESTQMEGIGLSNFKFKLNLPDPKKYLDVRLTVKENTGGDISRQGHADILVTLNSNGNTIGAFGTTVSIDTDPAAPIVSMADEICTTGIESAVCPVSKNQIIGIKAADTNMTDFLWAIDGKPITYSTCFFDGCDLSKQSDSAYFPILKEVGEKYTVTLTAANLDTGEKINLSREFKVVEPTISITSADESVSGPIQLGNYIDLNGTKWPDYSAENFWGISNSTIQLKAVTTGFTPAAGSYIWAINGYAAGTDETLAISAGQDGDSYEIYVQTLYSQDNPTKIALTKYWNVPYEQLYENNISSSITLNIQDGTPITASTKNKKIMATIYTSIPSYLAFLLRIVLTAFLILFVSQIILMFFPRINREN